MPLNYKKHFFKIRTTQRPKQDKTQMFKKRKTNSVYNGLFFTNRGFVVQTANSDVEQIR
jgi:hypothetical protein